MDTVLVIFGGKSSEYEVSLRSSASVLRNIDRAKYTVEALGITKEGKWLYYTGSINDIEDDNWQKNTYPALINTNFGSNELLIFKNGNTEKLHIDVVFPVLHGKNGEDGTLQGLFTLAGIPYVGCDTLSDAMSMDKAITNTLADYNNIPQAKWLQVLSYEYESVKNELLDKCEKYLGFPVFVKPANAGSSVGVSKANSKEETDRALKIAFKHDKKVVIEEGINGHEVECAVLGNENPVASVVGEIKPCNEFYDYEAKYAGDNSELIIPAKLDDDVSETVRKLALKVYKAMGCSGLSRIDFFVQFADNKVKFNELNTLPGFTSISMYPKLMGAIGIDYSDLITRLIEFAKNRVL